MPTVPDRNTSVQTSRDSKDLFLEIDNESLGMGKIKDYMNNILVSNILTDINEVEVERKHQNTAKHNFISTFNVANTFKDFREEIQHSSSIIEAPKETHNWRPRGRSKKRFVIN